MRLVQFPGSFTLTAERGHQFALGRDDQDLRQLPVDEVHIAVAADHGIEDHAQQDVFVVLAADAPLLDQFHGAGGRRIGGQGDGRRGGKSDSGSHDQKGYQGHVADGNMIHGFSPRMGWMVGRIDRGNKNSRVGRRVFQLPRCQLVPDLKRRTPAKQVRGGKNPDRRKIRN